MRYGYGNVRAAQPAGADDREMMGKEGKSGGWVESRMEGIYTPRKLESSGHRGLEDLEKF